MRALVGAPCNFRLVQLIFWELVGTMHPGLLHLTKSSSLLLTFSYSEGQNIPQRSEPVGGTNNFPLTINLGLENPLTLKQNMQRWAGQLGT
jgi:hypothetical protein